MATILPFAIRPRATATGRPDGGPAVVVIFPGVRREPGKAGSSVQTTGPSGRSSGKRKKST